jgi:EKC/KEOPS complex subunit CGI121/TPRKB
MESHVLSHLPLELSTLHYQLFTQVKNAGELRQRLINASKMEGTEGEEEREKVDFCFVDAQMVSLQCSQEVFAGGYTSHWLVRRSLRECIC